MRVHVTSADQAGLVPSERCPASSRPEAAPCARPPGRGPAGSVPASWRFRDTRCGCCAARGGSRGSGRALAPCPDHEARACYVAWGLPRAHCLLPWKATRRQHPVLAGARERWCWARHLLGPRARLQALRPLPARWGLAHLLVGLGTRCPLPGREFEPRVPARRSAPQPPDRCQPFRLQRAARPSQSLPVYQSLPRRRTQPHETCKEHVNSKTRPRCVCSAQSVQRRAAPAPGVGCTRRAPSQPIPAAAPVVFGVWIWVVGFYY